MVFSRFNKWLDGQLAADKASYAEDSAFSARNTAREQKPEDDGFDWDARIKEVQERCAKRAQAQKGADESFQEGFKISASRDRDIVRIVCGESEASFHIRNYAATFIQGRAGRVQEDLGYVTRTRFHEDGEFIWFRPINGHLSDEYKTIMCDKYFESRPHKAVIAGQELYIPYSRMDDFKDALFAALAQ